MYLSTSKMAKTMGYCPDFLLNNRDILFFEGEHFFPKDHRINWKIDKMIGWIENKTLSIQALEILQRVS